MDRLSTDASVLIVHDRHGCTVDIQLLYRDTGKSLVTGRRLRPNVKLSSYKIFYIVTLHCAFYLNRFVLKAPTTLYGPCRNYCD